MLAGVANPFHQYNHGSLAVGNEGQKAAAVAVQVSRHLAPLDIYRQEPPNLAPAEDPILLNNAPPLRHGLDAFADGRPLPLSPRSPHAAM
jgi:hypothetical protein